MPETYHYDFRKCYKNFIGTILEYTILEWGRGVQIKINIFSCKYPSLQLVPCMLALRHLFLIRRLQFHVINVAIALEDINFRGYLSLSQANCYNILTTYFLYGIETKNIITR